ncbi:MAG TPA: sugar transferase [Candidatus Paceibacterota bacterium]|nr:sugar transferase [Candidatus Paceibacterota bacterium]
MTLMPKREYIALLVGDLIVFAASLWLTLALRYLEPPSFALFQLHVEPFSILFVAWIVVFFLAGLYGRHTPLFRSRLLATIFYTQLVNVIIAALFFFLVPAFGIAPKTILFLYLLVSSVLIFLWRVSLYPKMRSGKKVRGVLIASGADAKALADEIGTGRYAFAFDHAIDTKQSPTYEVIQRAYRIAVDHNVAFIVVDFSDPAVASALPIIYDAAFHRHIWLIDAIDLYQEVFEREPLSWVNYGWVLANLSTSYIYDTFKRLIDIVVAGIALIVSLIFYPFVALAIKLDDGGSIFITQERVGRYQEPIKIIKFRSMSGNDSGNYGKSGKSQLVVTRVGRWLRASRIDELPQLWNIVKGDLSIVGPRPELPSIAALYNAKIPYYNARYLVAPGLTGWAQLQHDRDPHHGHAIQETKEKLSYDLYYLKHRSLILDLFIMLQTVRIVVSARGH